MINKPQIEDILADIELVIKDYADYIEYLEGHIGDLEQKIWELEKKE